MNLVFISYINRSGSTFLLNLFSKSKDILACPEAEILVNEFLILPEKKFTLNELYIQKLNKYIKHDLKFKNWNLKFQEISGIKNVRKNFDAFVYILNKYREKVKPKAKFIIFKAERIVHLYNSISEEDKIKYNLKLILIIRDCRAIFASQKSTYFIDKQKPMSSNPVYTAILWNIFLSKYKILKKRNDVILIKFEDLISNLHAKFCELLDIISISEFDFSDSVAGDLYDRIPLNQKEIHKNILDAQKLDKINDWNQTLSRKEIKLIELTSCKYLQLFGYEIFDQRFNIIYIFLLFKFLYNYLKFYLVLLTKKILFKINILLRNES